SRADPDSHSAIFSQPLLKPAKRPHRRGVLATISSQRPAVWRFFFLARLSTRHSQQFMSAPDRNDDCIPLLRYDLTKMLLSPCLAKVRLSVDNQGYEINRLYTPLTTI